MLIWKKPGLTFTPLFNLNNQGFLSCFVFQTFRWKHKKVCLGLRGIYQSFAKFNATVCWFRNPARKPPGMVLKPCKSWDKLSAGFLAGFLVAINSILSTLASLDKICRLQNMFLCSPNPPNKKKHLKPWPYVIGWQDPGPHDFHLSLFHGFSQLPRFPPRKTHWSPLRPPKILHTSAFRP